MSVVALGKQDAALWKWFVALRGTVLPRQLLNWSKSLSQGNWDKWGGACNRSHAAGLDAKSV